MVDFEPPVWIGGGVAIFIFVLVLIMIAACSVRRKAGNFQGTPASMPTTTNGNNHSSMQVPRHPIHPQQHSQVLPNPYQTPYQHPSYPPQAHHQPHFQQHFHSPHAVQPLQRPHSHPHPHPHSHPHSHPHPHHPHPHHHHHHHSPHTVLFPSHPVQTIFPVIPRLQGASMDDDHSLRPVSGLSDTISLDELNSFDVKGEDKDSPCPICLAPLEEEPVSAGNCLHLAHTSCLKSWLVKDTKFACPVCRVPYTDTSNDDIAITLAAPG